MCWPRTAPDCLGNGILHSSLNRRLFPIRSACRRVGGTAGRLIAGRQLALLFGQQHPATDAEIARRARRQRTPFSRGRIRALALAPAKQGRYLLVAFLLTMLYLLLHSALSLVFALVSFVLAMLCARENQKAFRL